MWGQSTLIISKLPPKRDCGPKGVKDIGGNKRRDRNGNACLDGPLDFAKMLKLSFRVVVGDLDLPGKRKRYTSSRAEEESRCTDVPVGQSNREWSSQSRRM